MCVCVELSAAVVVTDYIRVFPGKTEKQYLSLSQFFHTMELEAYVNWFWTRYWLRFGHRRKKSVAHGKLISPGGMEAPLHIADSQPEFLSTPSTFLCPSQSFEVDTLTTRQENDDDDGQGWGATQRRTGTRQTKLLTKIEYNTRGKHLSAVVRQTVHLELGPVQWVERGK